MGRKPSEKTIRQYLDNQKFVEELEKWDRSKPMPDIIGKYIYDIIENLGRSGRFNGYTWLDSMKGDALIACIKGIKNFDINKSKNAFAYVTMICWHSFIERIKKENKLVAAKNEYINDACNMLYDTIDGDEISYNNINERAAMTNIIQYNHGTVHTTKEKKKTKKSGQIDGFI